MLRFSGLKRASKSIEVVYNKYLLPRIFSIISSHRNEESLPPTNVSEPSIPPYVEKPNEPLEIKRARLLYQSRKRGMLENGLLLSTFAAKYLSTMTPDMLKDYDRLINLPSNDWDLYYWATGVKATPSEFDTEIMKMLKDHVRNDDRQSRIRQPDLY